MATIAHVSPFEGERPEHHMKKLAAGNPAVTCASCRRFDGAGWCWRWNYATAADAPICAHYRAAPTRPGTG